jgi:hypothetical protein
LPSKQTHGSVQVQRTFSDQYCSAIRARFLLLSWHSSVRAGALHLSFNSDAIAPMDQPIGFGSVQVQRTFSDQRCSAIKARFLLLSWHSSVRAGALHLSFNSNAIAPTERPIGFASAGLLC